MVSSHSSLGAPRWLADRISTAIDQSQTAFDPDLFTAILLAQIAAGPSGTGKNLIVVVPSREDASTKAVAMVAVICSNLLDLPTQTIELTPNLSPAQFSRDIFISSASASSRAPPPRSSRDPAHASNLRLPLRSSSTDTTSPISPTSPTFHSQRHHQQHHHRHHSSRTDASSIGNPTTPFSSADRSTSRHQSRANGISAHTTSSTRPIRPISEFYAPPESSTSIAAQLHEDEPDDASQPVPTTMDPFASPTPDQYYPTSSPLSDPILSSVTPASLVPSVYLPRILILKSLSKASHHLHLHLGELLRTRRLSIPSPSPKPSSRKDARGNEVYDYQREQQDPGGLPEGVWNLPSGFSVIWVVEEDELQGGAGISHGRGVPCWLIDFFAFSWDIPLPFPPEADYEFLPPLKRASHFPSSELAHLSKTLHSSIYIAPTLKTYIADLVSATLHHPHLAAHITPRTRTDLVDLTRAARLLLRPFDVPSDMVGDGGESGRDKIWATPDDVRRVLVGCLKHRVGLRGVRSGGVMGRRARGEIMGVLNRVRVDVTRDGAGRGSAMVERVPEEEAEGEGWERLEAERVLLEILETV